MKNILKPLVFSMLLTMSLTNLQAQNPPHPNGGNAPANGNTVGSNNAGAPIGSGNFLLFGLALLYATKKVTSTCNQTKA